jgi:hypothetical protein
MGGPSVSCLFYLFADSAELGIVRRRGGPQVAIPGSASTVPLGPLETLLLRVAIWELVTAGNVKAVIDVTDVEPWRLGRSRTRTQLNLYRQPIAATSPPSGSLAEQLLAMISADGTNAAVAVINWAGECWPLPLDALVAVAVDEAVDHGVLLQVLAGTARRPHRWAVSRRVVITSLEADVDVLDAIRPAFNRACTDWDSYEADCPDENRILKRDCRGALASLRPRPSGSGASG